MPVATRRSGQTSASAEPPALTPDTKRRRAADDVDEVRPPKRKRLGASTSKTPHKKRVGNENESMMTLPIEIFIQVLDYATPCALVALIRTNKTFRRILLDPSARPLWQAAESRVPGLPCCPSWMSEPRYAALLFSNLCTICGAVTTLKLDTQLFVRLCASCRKTEVVGSDKVRAGRKSAFWAWVNWSNEINPKSSRSYALRREVDQIQEEHAELSKPMNRYNLQKWEGKKSSERNGRYQFRWRLAEYLQEIEKAHQREMKAIKEQRRQLIYERLQTLEWAGEDIKIDDAYAKPWKALVDVPQPLSDKGTYPTS
ncbi:hypothetical protein FS749_006268 [Ceratobasidium sp. UAMH 11750]|nr:hypothetical protein FS749_006268 [Ceratobasidium sp. UAMH 11750]